MIFQAGRRPAFFGCVFWVKLPISGGNTAAMIGTFRAKSEETRKRNRQPVGKIPGKYKKRDGQGLTSFGRTDIMRSSYETGRL